jgi:hypothetical protein
MDRLRGGLAMEGFDLSIEVSIHMNQAAATPAWRCPHRESTMRIHQTILLAVAAMLSCAAEGEAQGYYVSPYWGGPYYPPAAYRGYAFASPYGYRTYSSVTVYPRVYGPAVVYGSGTFVRPIYTGSYMSVYFDPFAGTYRYAPGYRNAPTYYYYYQGTNPYYPYGPYYPE